MIRIVFVICSDTLSVFINSEFNSVKMISYWEKLPLCRKNVYLPKVSLDLVLSFDAGLVTLYELYDIIYVDCP